MHEARTLTERASDSKPYLYIQSVQLFSFTNKMFGLFYQENMLTWTRQLRQRGGMSRVSLISDEGVL